MLVTVDKFPAALAAHIVRGRPEAEGIPAVLAHEHHVWANWTITLALGYVKLQVPYETIADSLAIIGKLHAGDFILDDPDSGTQPSVCPRCGHHGHVP